MIRAPRIEPRPAPRTGISTAKIFRDRKRPVTSAAKDRMTFPFVFAPDGRRMAGQFLVTMDAGIKRIATFEFHRHDIPVAVVMGTLGQFVYAGAAHHHLFSLPIVGRLAHVSNQ